MQLYSILRRANRAGKSIVHSHDMWELILTSAGHGDIVVEDKQYAFYPGSLLCVPPGRVHYNTAREDYVHIAIRIRDFVSPAGETVQTFQDDVEKTFETIAGILLRVFFGREPARELLLNSLYDSLYGLLVRWSEPQQRNEEVELVKNVMIANFSDPEFHAASATTNIHYSTDYFRKLFRQETGMTPPQYLTGLRIQYAKKLLGSSGTGQERISDIALRSGFYDARYFARVFKALQGVTPQEYRAWVRSNEKFETEGK